MQVYFIIPWWIYRKYFKSIKKKKMTTFRINISFKYIWGYAMISIQGSNNESSFGLKKKKITRGYPGVLGLRISGLD